MKREIAVSVIVPIYNVEPYLRECIESILAQSLTEIEIILVDGQYRQRNSLVFKLLALLYLVRLTQEDLIFCSQLE